MEVKKTHIGAYGIIIEDNKIALIRKARGGYKGKLDMPGGGIEHTETPNETLKRELIEEIGVEIEDYKLFDVTSVNIKWEYKENEYEDLHHIGVLYLVNIKNNNLKQEADGLDSLGADWYKIDNLKEEDVSPLTWYSIKKLGIK